MASNTVRQVAVTAPEQIEIREIERPRPGVGEVVVQTNVVGICGSDLHAVHGRHPFISLPYIPGHEVAGTVSEVGPEVSAFQPGDRVLVEPNLVCGECPYCSSGRYNLCENLVVLGCQTPGAMADAFVVPAARLHHVPDALNDAQAALVEPLSTATHAVRIAGDLQGKLVAVLGAGTIGLLTMLAALAAGARAIAVTDLQAEKRERAQRLGALAAFNPREDDVVVAIKTALGARPDVIFDCVSNQSSMNQAIELARNGGTVMVVGVAEESVTVPLPIIQDKEIRIEGSAMYVRQDVEKAIELIAAGKVPVDEIVTARYPLDHVSEAFAAAQSGPQVKVHLIVNG